MKEWFLTTILVLSLEVFSTEKWVNYLGNQRCQPCLYSEPRTFEELCDHIEQAALHGHVVRAIGNGYSISDIGCTDGSLVSLKQLKRVLFIDLESKQVRVEAGIRLQELNECLAASGLALSNQAAISQITLAGALSTGVHGTGHTGTLSSFVREIELITADGALHKLSKASDPDAFAAAGVGLGSLGIIYAVTVQCEPLFYLRASSEVTDLENILENYKELNCSNDFLQFSWNVETDNVVVNGWNRCQQEASQATECVVAHKALSWYVIDESDRDLFSEIAVPVDSLPDAIRAVKKLAQKYQEAGVKIADVNIRFVEQDEHTFLSPASDGPVAYIALCISDEDKYLALYKELEDALFAHHGRPHWGKIHFLDQQRVVNLYGVNLQKFITVKRRLDPKGVFSNAFTDRIFGLQK